MNGHAHANGNGLASSSSSSASFLNGLENYHSNGNGLHIAGVSNGVKYENGANGKQKKLLAADEPEPVPVKCVAQKRMQVSFVLSVCICDYRITVAITPITLYVYVC